MIWNSSFWSNAMKRPTVRQRGAFRTLGICENGGERFLSFSPDLNVFQRRFINFRPFMCKFDDYLKMTSLPNVDVHTSVHDIL